MRRSTYTIDVEYKDQRVWINSLTGAIDLLPGPLAESIDHDIAAVAPEVLTALGQRGHVTALDVDDERRHALKAWEWMDGEHRKSAKIVICPSMDCNFRCGYCFESDLQARIDRGEVPPRSLHLSSAQVDVIFDSLPALCDINGDYSRHITLFGGEPLWPRNLATVEHIAERAAAGGFTLSAITNGYHLSAFSHLFGPDGIRRIQVSLDGPAEIHDKMRPLAQGGPTFARILAELRAVADIPGLFIEIRMNYNAGNMQAAPELHQTLTEAGLLGRPNVGFHANLISMTHAGEHKDFETIKQYARISAHIPDAELDCYTSGLRAQFVAALETGAPLARRAHFCAATSGMYVFCPDNQIYSCWEGIGEAHSRIGSFADGIRWRDETLRRWHARTAPAMPKCQTCSHLFVCGGGCTVHAIEQGKDMNTSQCDGLRKKYGYMVQKTMAQRDPANLVSG